MGPLPEHLTAAGFAVARPALRGHGTHPQDLAKVRYTDWLEDAYEAFLTLPEPRGVVGLSMGGLLAAWVAAELGAKALVALAPALGFKSPLAPLAPYLWPLIPRYAGESSIHDPELRKKSPNYPWFPSRAFVELYKLAKKTPPVLRRLKAPALVVEAEYDTVVPARAVRRYYDLLGSEEKEYRVLRGSGHDMLLDREAKTAARWTTAFFERHLL